MKAHAHSMIAVARQQGSQPQLRILNRSQTGSMLLESFIAILIFSMGILAIVGMQASAVKNSTDARYRSEASLLANELIGRMWVSNRTPATLQTNFQGGGGTDGAAYTAWYATVQTTLPGAAANPPTVTIDPVTSLVTVAVLWKAPSEPAADPAHRFSLIAQVR